MPSSRPRAVVAWLLAIALAALFILAAVGKLTGAATEMFTGWGYPAWFALLIGVVEAAGAVGLLIPKTTRCAIYALTLVMLGAAYTHLANGEGLQVLRPLVFLAVLWVLWWLRRKGSSPLAARPALS